MLDLKSGYCSSLCSYERRESVSVKVGNVVIGSGHGIVLQSMCTTSTEDTEATVAQIKSLREAGAEIVRMTASTRGEAENLRNIRRRLNEEKVSVALVADVHFNPEAAIIAAESVDKVRINPGNFIDKRADFSIVEYTDEEYAEELERLKNKLEILLTVCRTRGVALRVGVNHGSLSDRIMSRYGDTPEGMTVSAMEFLRVCRNFGFNDVVVSMKSSNPQVMVRAYRMLTAAMNDEKMSYPLHLGVTEAGNGEDGRIKSAVGIGALLNDGLGDTIRVSLTETPENELPVAREIVRYYKERAIKHQPICDCDASTYFAYEYKKRESRSRGIIGGNQPAVAVLDLSATKDLTEELLLEIIEEFDTKPDLIYTGAEDLNIKGVETFCDDNISSCDDIDESNHYINISLPSLSPKVSMSIKQYPSKILILSTSNSNGVAEQRACFLKLEAAGIKNPVIIRRTYDEGNESAFVIKASCDCGMLFIDGMGDGLWLSSRSTRIEPKTAIATTFSILQACRARITKTEYIACPSCGRTKFNLQKTLSEVKERTSHLKGLKIAVMGCIVNGPGEMADADYGYVGAGSGLVWIYKGREVLRKGVPESEAVDALIDEIKKAGDYKEVQ